MLMSIAFIQDDGLTFREVIGGIPHDAGAILAFILIAIFIGVIWLGSRNTATPPPPEDQAPSPAPAGERKSPVKAARKQHR
jgi:hypothetical protein